MSIPQTRRAFIANAARCLSIGALFPARPEDIINGMLPKNPLSPAHWGEEERARYWRLTTEMSRPKPVARGRKAIVVGTTGAFAIRAGMEAIHHGGNAVDAAITTALTQVSMTAGGPTSYAGVMNCLYFDARRGSVQTLDGGYDVPREETDPLTIPRWGTSSGRAVLVPGFMPGMEALHKRFGGLPFSNLFDPAIYLAEEGFELSVPLEQLIQSRRGVLGNSSEAKEIFCKSDGTFRSAGDRLYQPSLAKTLGNVAKHGAEYMATGDWGQKFCRVVQQAGGRIRREDLKRYSPVWSAPHSTTYGGREVFASYAGQPGGVSLVESLNLMELAGLGETAHYTESPEAFYWLTQIALMSTALNFPESYRFEQEFPSLSLRAEDRVTKGHAEAIWHKLREPGWLHEFIPNILTMGSHSDAIVAIDDEGNIAVLSHSINSAPWSNAGLFVDGVSVPDSGAFLQREMLGAGPGKRIWAGFNPHILLEDGRPVLAGASIGSCMHSTTMQRLSSVLDGKMDLSAAIEAPVFHGPYFEDNYIKLGVQKKAFSGELLSGVRKKGQDVLLLDERECWTHRGYWIGLAVNPESRERTGSTCWELNGYAVGN